MRGRFLPSQYVLILGELPGPLFLSFLGSGGHSSPGPWLESSNSRLCQKMKPPGLSFFFFFFVSAQNRSQTLSSQGMKPWHAAASSVSRPRHASVKPSLTFLLYWIPLLCSLPKCFFYIDFYTEGGGHKKNETRRASFREKQQQLVTASRGQTLPLQILSLLLFLSLFAGIGLYPQHLSCRLQFMRLPPAASPDLMFDW